MGSGNNILQPDPMNPNQMVSVVPSLPPNGVTLSPNAPVQGYQAPTISEYESDEEKTWSKVDCQRSGKKITQKLKRMPFYRYSTWQRANFRRFACFMQHTNYTVRWWWRKWNGKKKVCIEWKRPWGINRCMMIGRSSKLSGKWSHFTLLSTIANTPFDRK